MGRASSGKNTKANLECCPLFVRSSSTWSNTIDGQDPRIARANTAQNTKRSALLSCLAQRLSASTSRCGTDTAGRRELLPTPEESAQTKLFDRGFLLFRESHTEARYKKKCLPNT